MNFKNDLISTLIPTVLIYSVFINLVFLLYRKFFIKGDKINFKKHLIVSIIIIFVLFSVLIVINSIAKKNFVSIPVFYLTIKAN